MIMAGTGHRPNKLGGEYDYKGPISRYVGGQILRYLYIHKPKKVISGLAQGFDTLLAIVAIKNNYPLMAYVPFKGQETAWPEGAAIDIYYWILKRSTDIYVVDIDKWVTYQEFLALKQTGYHPDKLQKRNEKMVDDAEMLMACFNGSKGGTANCMKYALVEAGYTEADILTIDPRKAPSRKQYHL